MPTIEVWQYHPDGNYPISIADSDTGLVRTFDKSGKVTATRAVNDDEATHLQELVDAQDAPTPVTIEDLAAQVKQLRRETKPLDIAVSDNR